MSRIGKKPVAMPAGVSANVEGQPAIQHLVRVSKPGRRVYSAARELPRIRNGLGTIIVSTPRGVLSDAEAREHNVGGEVLAEVF
jgi:small subunit ribosomal protein S8